MNYTEVDVSGDRTAAEEMIRVSGQRGVPVIVVDGQLIIGFNQARLQQILGGAGGSKPPHFGLRVADSSKVAPKFGVAPVLGALVGRVALSSPGERAGLKAGDIITSINLKQVNNADELERVLGSLQVGSRVEIVFMRGDERKRMKIVL